MKKVLIAVERSKFNYLYKYDEIIVSNTNIIHLGIDELITKSKNNLKETAILIERSLPVFESEDEVLLIEVDADAINFDLTFSFKAMLGIIPLNGISKELLQTKLNTDLVISNSLPEMLFNEIFRQRELKQRAKLAKEILSLFTLPLPTKDLQSSVLDALSTKLLGLEKGHKSIFYHLFSIDSTPSGIPSGNIEGLMKVICLGLMKAIGHMDQLRKSPLYKYLLNNYELINSEDLQKSYDTFQRLIKGKADLVEKLSDTIKIEGCEGDSYKTFYYYFLLKNSIQSSEGNLVRWAEILNKTAVSKHELSIAMYLVVVTVSFKEIYESYQKTRNSKLFGKNKTSELFVIYNNESLVSDKFEEIPSKSQIRDVDLSKEDSLINSCSIAEAGVSESESSNHTLGNDTPINTTSDFNKSDTNSSNLIHTDSNDRYEEIKELQNKIKGAGKKDVLETINQLYKENRSFTTNELEGRLKDNKKLINGKGTLKKIAIEALQKLF